jgi:hypothetical protein
LSLGLFGHPVVFVEVELGLLDVLEFEVALCQAGMSLHFFELERILSFLFVGSFFIIPSLIFIDGLLELDQILFLILNASLVLPFKIVELPNFMRNSGLALSFS